MQPPMHARSRALGVRSHACTFPCVARISIALHRCLRRYRSQGLVAGAAAAVCFLVGLDDAVDPYRLFHGLSQALVGGALYYLWQLVPLNLNKKTDEDISVDGFPAVDR